VVESDLIALPHGATFARMMRVAEWGGQTMTIKNTTATVNLPALPKLPKMRKGGSGICLCGCGAATSGGRFAPGHDARLLAVVLRIERGIMTEESAGVHGKTAMIEVGLRAKAGLTGESHAKVQMTAQDAAGIERPKAKKEAKPRLVRKPKAVEPTVDAPALDATGTDGQ
jgi:hypothetical protein